MVTYYKKTASKSLK